VVLNSVFVGAGSYGVAVNPTLNMIYVTNRDSLNIALVNGFTLEVVQHVAAGGSPYAAAFNPATNKLYVLVAASSNHRNPNRLKIYNGTGGALFLHKTVSINNMAEGGLAINSATNHLFVPHSSTVSRVSVIDGNSDTVIGILTPPAYPLDDPFGMGVNPNTGWVYVGNRSFDGVDGSIVTILDDF